MSGADSLLRLQLHAQRQRLAALVRQQAVRLPQRRPHQQALGFIATAPDRLLPRAGHFNPHRPSPVAVQQQGHAPRRGRAPLAQLQRATGPTSPPGCASCPTCALSCRPGWTRCGASGRSRRSRWPTPSTRCSAELVASGRAASTLIIVTSDNGYHAGSAPHARRQAHGLPRGHRRADGRRSARASTPGATRRRDDVDRRPRPHHRPSCSARQTPAWVDGRSLRGDPRRPAPCPTDWRTAALSESMGRSTPEGSGLPARCAAASSPRCARPSGCSCLPRRRARALQPRGGSVRAQQHRQHGRSGTWSAPELPAAGDACLRGPSCRIADSCRCRRRPLSRSQAVRHRRRASAVGRLVRASNAL